MSLPNNVVSVSISLNSTLKFGINRRFMSEIFLLPPLTLPLVLGIQASMSSMIGKHFALNCVPGPCNCFQNFSLVHFTTWKQSFSVVIILAQIICVHLTEMCMYIDFGGGVETRFHSINQAGFGPDFLVWASEMLGLHVCSLTPTLHLWLPVFLFAPLEYGWQKWWKWKVK